MKYNVNIKEMPERKVASLRKVIGSYPQEGELWNQIRSEIAPQNPKFSNPAYRVAIYRDEEYKEENPDIVHLHSSKAGFLGRLCCTDREREVFYNPHGYSFLMEDAKNIQKIMYKSIEWLSSKKCGYIVACSKGEYKEALKLSKKSFLLL